MQIKNIKIFDSTNAADGSWIDISNLVALSVQAVGLEGKVWVEVSNDPLVNIDNPTPQISAPSAPTLSQYAYGALVSQGTYYVKITYTTPYGETNASAESTLAVSNGNVLTVKAPAPDAAGVATGWNVYVSKTTGQEVLQTVPAYTPAWVTDSTPGIHYAISGNLSLSQSFVLTNGFSDSGVVPPSNTGGGPNVGIDITGNLAGTITANDEIAIFQNAGKTMAMVNPSCLSWKWLRVRKDNSAQTTETVAYLMGQNG